MNNDNYWLNRIKTEIFIGDRVRFVRPYKEKAFEDNWMHGTVTDKLEHYIVVTSKNYNVAFNYHDFIGEDRTIEIVG